MLGRLANWARAQAASDATAPRLVLLVGGPGNGKTDAIESVVGDLDKALGCEGALVQAVSAGFDEEEGDITPRIVLVDAGAAAPGRPGLQLEVVQDASLIGGDGRSVAQLLLGELASAISDPNRLYLCCVNRGVLDDALIHAVQHKGMEAQRALLEEIVTAASLSPDAPPCWPLKGHPAVAVWPMDAESLIENTEDGGAPAAGKILELATAKDRWPLAGSCVAGASCPFCTSRQLLAGRQESAALLRILRYYELASGKRWTFRDLFSLVSYLLAGNGELGGEAGRDPCAWAARLVAEDQDRALQARPRKSTSSALFELVAAQYQHALFHGWDAAGAPSAWTDIKDLGLRDDHTAMGLYYFLAGRSAAGPPSTLEPIIEDLIGLLDPALADPAANATFQAKTFDFGGLQSRFSRSVSDGLAFVGSARVLTRNEQELLRRLAELDTKLSRPEVRRKRPAAATRLQHLARDFACRLACRSIGARRAIVPDAKVLDDFHRLAADSDGRGRELRSVAKQVEALLNSGHDFEISLTTTFGQPTPSLRRRATLSVGKRQVRGLQMHAEGRPAPPLGYLVVDTAGGGQPVALTYELFKSVSELSGGMSRGSLPKSVIALLDTTKARLAGAIVRDPDVFERANIRLGDGVEVERDMGEFVAWKPGERR
ncbi:MAG TPA: hypothetical protein VN158_10055 [Caulobacter sp.]|nr:hypothetical protein [Caulobacter sp.]